jgi:hypothetical protein
MCNGITDRRTGRQTDGRTEIQILTIVYDIYILLIVFVVVVVTMMVVVVVVVVVLVVVLVVM